jgi:hypothetical protein
MSDLKRGLAVVCLSMLLAGCAAAVGDADADRIRAAAFTMGEH